MVPPEMSRRPISSSALDTEGPEQKVMLAMGVLLFFPALSIGPHWGQIGTGAVCREPFAEP
jgi:hypothetical protein